MISELLNLLVRMDYFTADQAMSLQNMQPGLFLRHLVSKKLFARQDIKYILGLLHDFDKTSSDREKNSLRSKLLDVVIEAMHAKIVEIELTSEITRKRVTSQEYLAVGHLVKPDKDSTD